VQPFIETGCSTIDCPGPMPIPYSAYLLRENKLKARALNSAPG